MPANEHVANLSSYFKHSYENFNWGTFILKQDFYEFFLTCHFCWWILYGLVHFLVPVRLEKRKDINDTKTRIISIVHASLIFLLSFYDLVCNQGDKCGQTNTDFQNKILLLSAAYFLYDMIACILLDCSDNEMVVHHLFCILGLYTGVAYNNSANEMVRALIITEVTCPIMHFRMILKNYTLKHTKLHVLLDFVYMFLYLIARTIYGTINVIFTLFCWDNLMLVKLAGTFVWVQSLLFSKRMISILRHRFKEYQERKAKKVELYWITHNKKVEELEYYKKAKTKPGYIP